MGAKDYFLLVDHDRGEFNILGPVWTEELHERWMDAVLAAKGKGRKVLCSTFIEANLQKQIREYAEEQGLKHTKEPLLPEIDSQPR